MIHSQDIRRPLGIAHTIPARGAHPRRRLRHSWQPAARRQATGHRAHAHCERCRLDSRRRTRGQRTARLDHHRAHRSQGRACGPDRRRSGDLSWADLTGPKSRELRRRIQPILEFATSGGRIRPIPEVATLSGRIYPAEEVTAAARAGRAIFASRAAEIAESGPHTHKSLEAVDLEAETRVDDPASREVIGEPLGEPAC